MDKPVKCYRNNFYSRILSGAGNTLFIFQFLFASIILFTSLESKAITSSAGYKSDDLAFADVVKTSLNDECFQLVELEVKGLFIEKNDEDDEEDKYFFVNESTDSRPSDNVLSICTAHFFSKQKVKFYILFHSWRNFIS